MELSLDDFIKKKKFDNGKPGNGITKKFAPNKSTLHKTMKKSIFRESARTRPMNDARMKIVQSNRAKIRDARDKLVQLTRIKGDARHLIEKRRGPIIRNGVHRNGRFEIPTGRNFEPKPILRRKVYPDVAGVPRGYIDYDNMEMVEQQEYKMVPGLSRTVHNDLRMDTYEGPRTEPIPPPPAPRRVNSWGSQSSEPFIDPFEVYEVSHTRRERRMSPAELPPPPPKGILRSRTRQRSPEHYQHQQRYIPEPASHLSYEMICRLENAPDPHASMGIFSNPLRSSSSMPAHSIKGYRIVVSNLNPSVTQSDIRELFEDIGELYDSRIVRPGVAEVIYKSLGDAEKAVDTYHNRQLDRQPMKCLLVNPRASDKPTAPAIKTPSSNSSSRPAPSKTPLEIDIDALHKVLFRRH